MKISLNDKIIEQNGNNTILDSVFAACGENQVLLEYQCRDGFCGTCRCKLISGKVGYIKSTLAYLKQDEILPCSAIPLTDIILEK